MITTFNCYEDESDHIHPLKELINKVISSVTFNSTEVFTYLKQLDTYLQQIPATQTELLPSDLKAIADSCIDQEILNRFDVELYFRNYFHTYIYSQIIQMDFRHLSFYLLRELKPHKETYLESFITKAIMYNSINTVDMLMFEWIENPNQVISGSNLLTIALKNGKIEIADMLYAKYGCLLDEFTDADGVRVDSQLIAPSLTQIISTKNHISTFEKIKCMSKAIYEYDVNIDPNVENSICMPPLISAFSENMIVAQFLLETSLKRGVSVDYAELIGTAIHSFMDTEEKFKILDFIATKVDLEEISGLEDALIDHIRYSFMFDNTSTEVISILLWLNAHNIFLSQYKIQQAAIQHNRYDYIDEVRFTEVEFLIE